MIEKTIEEIDSLECMWRVNKKFVDRGCPVTPFEEEMVRRGLLGAAEKKGSPLVVLISGFARAGKDASANLLKTSLEGMGLRVKITHYADHLKNLCRDWLDWDGVKDDYGRSLLQYVGTNIVREQYPAYWVDHMVQMLKFFGSMFDAVLIPDTRFPNEIERIRQSGYNIVHMRIDRGPGFDNGLTDEQKDHISETALLDYPRDILVENDGTLNDLDYKMKEVAKNLDEMIKGVQNSI